MKKLFAVFIAMCVLLCFTAVLAADDEPALDCNEIFMAVNGSVPKQLDHAGESLRMEIEPESTLYFSIKGARRAENLNGLKAYISWSKGEEYAVAPRIEYKEMFDETAAVSLGYRYVISLKMAEISDETTHTLRGSVKLSKRASHSAPSVSFTLALKKGAKDISSSVVSCRSPNTIMSFEDITDTAIIYFYDFAWLEVNAFGQNRINIGCSQEPLTDIEQRYPAAVIRYIVWGKEPIFDHEGTLFIPSDSNMYLYELNGSKLVDRTDTYSENDGAFVIKTRRLEGFVLSDRELANDATTPAQPNPPTFFAL